MDLFDIAIARKLSGGSGGGGGGSSDFSTATVTVTNSSLYGFNLILASVMEEEGEGFVYPVYSSSQIEGVMPLDAILYQGNAMCEIIPTENDTPTVTVSGDIQNIANLFYIITGDCTITIS